MNKLYSLVLALTVFITVPCNSLSAQCSNATINWDNLDYLVTTGSYSGFVSSAMSQNQRFAIGTNGLNIVTNAGVTINGATGNHTADAGNDVEYSISAGIITLTFDREVTNATFSIYDIDRRQIIAINSKNASGTDVTTTVVKRNPAATILTLAPLSGIGTTVTATSCTVSSCNVANGSNDGTIDISVSGPVKTVTLTFTNSGSAPSSPEIFLSDITACVTGNFATNYYQVSKPFTGQPGYVLTVVNNNFYYTNPANGVSYFLFSDPGHTYANSVGYDPYNGIIYYTYSLTSSPSSDKALKKYDLNTRTISTVLSDITTLGIPVFEYGIESGAANFYNGSYYLGIEGYNSSFNGGRKSLVWRIDFNGSNIPYRASQVFGSAADNGSGNILHDWSDIGCSNGILYDFDGAAGDEDFNVFNMQTGALTNYTPASGVVGRQVAIGWDEKIYNIGSTGTITQYNGTNGHTGSTYTITSTPAIPGGGSWGDAGEAFRPYVDFGDAPVSYDPVVGDPAVHDSSGTTIRLGTSFNTEVVKRGTTSMEDNFDDGLSTIPLMPSGSSAYLAQVSVFNNSGADATLCAWLDYNGNGIFNTGEGITQIVTSSASMQSKYLYWPSFTTPLTNGSFTYLRIRITSATNGMTTANPTGYFINGEVEDYRVIVDNYPLKADLLTFNAKALNSENVELKWKSSGEENLIGYEVQKSTSNANWEVVDFVLAKANGLSVETDYLYNDLRPLPGKSFYRLKLISSDNKFKYSEIKTVFIENGTQDVVLFPNPAFKKSGLMITTLMDASASIVVTDINGKILHRQSAFVRKGINNINLEHIEKMKSGFYFIQVEINKEMFVRKLMISQ